MGSMRLALVIGAAGAVVACGGERAGTRMPSGPAARVTLAQFGQLRWLEGRWRGAEVGGTPFFEAYGFVNDSTIRSYVYTDSTLTIVSDSGTILWHGDSITSGREAPNYVAVRFDSVSVEFAPLGAAANGFTWIHAGPGAWRARLTWDSAGVVRERTYDMRAIP